MLLLICEGNASFWFENWLGIGPLAEGKEDLPLPEVKIWELFGGTGRQLGQVRDALTHEELLQILNSGVHLLKGWDILVWTPSTDGRFKVQSALMQLRKSRHNLISRKLLWNRCIPLKISVFMWRLLNEWLPFSDKLQLLACTCLPSALFA